MKNSEFRIPGSFSGVIGLLIIGFVSCQTGRTPESVTDGKSSGRVTLSKDVMMDKIKGGWAGQVIGCTFGGPTEFDYCGTMIQEYVPIEWDDSKLEWYYLNAPGLYDDIYMDLTFVQVMEDQGVDAPASAHANAFAHAGYALWHANQSARYNILNGLEPPETGYWENNPHADDIDFQIEADFAGLMNPGMVNSSSGLCDRVGHIMNYGDGWYGGVYVAAMYALSFISDDISFIVKEALKTIPGESQFHQCISDVIAWYGKYPDDWKETWFRVQKKWSEDIGCPDGVFRAFDIDAKINAAYVVIGLLYGEGDFGKTVEISTRCGQDSDCNPASAGGILGTVLGYEGIPGFWKQGLKKVEDVDFKYTTISLSDSYDMSYRHALAMIKANGGEETDTAVVIRVEEPRPVELETSFEDHTPVKIMGFPDGSGRLEYHGALKSSFEFRGKGFVVNGDAGKLQGTEGEHDLKARVTIDGTLYEECLLPTRFQSRRNEITWAYHLEQGPHRVTIEWIDPEPGYRMDLYNLVVYE